MKISVVHHQYALGGGVEAYLQDLLKELLRQGHEVTLWVNKIDPKLPLPSGLKLKKISCCGLPKLLQQWYFVKNIIKKLQAEKADLIISTTRSLYQDITMVGGLHRSYLKNRKRWRLKDFSECYLECKAYENSKYVIANSPLTYVELKEDYHIPESKLKMFYPPVNAERFRYHCHATRKHQPFRLLFPSSSHKRKGGYLLLDAFELLPPGEFELWIAGRPFKEAQKFKNVRYLGFVDLAKVYPEVDLMVLPSYFEPFGMVMVEALECGTPVLVSKHTAAKDLLSPTEGLVLEDMSPEALADLLINARHTQFEIKPQFIERHGLSIKAHVDALLSLI